MQQLLNTLLSLEDYFRHKKSNALVNYNHEILSQEFEILSYNYETKKSKCKSVSPRVQIYISLYSQFTL